MSDGILGFNSLLFAWLSPFFIDKKTEVQKVKWTAHSHMTSWGQNSSERQSSEAELVLALEPEFWFRLMAFMT